MCSKYYNTLMRMMLTTTITTLLMIIITTLLMIIITTLLMKSLNTIMLSVVCKQKTIKAHLLAEATWAVTLREEGSCYIEGGGSCDSGGRGKHR